MNRIPLIELNPYYGNNGKMVGYFIREQNGDQSGVYAEKMDIPIIFNLPLQYERNSLIERRHNLLETIAPSGATHFVAGMADTNRLKGIWIEEIQFLRCRRQTDPFEQ